MSSRSGAKESLQERGTDRNGRITHGARCQRYKHAPGHDKSDESESRTTRQISRPNRAALQFTPGIQFIRPLLELSRCLAVADLVRGCDQVTEPRLRHVSHPLPDHKECFVDLVQQTDARTAGQQDNKKAQDTEALGGWPNAPALSQRPNRTSVRRVF